VARPPLRPAAFFCAVVPPCFELLPEPDFLPPRLDAPGELAIFAARSFDMPFLRRPSYCFSFLTFARLFGMACMWAGGGSVKPELGSSRKDARALAEFAATLALTVLLTWLLLLARRHLNGLVVSHYAGGGYSSRPAHPHLGHWLYVLARAAALVGAGIAVYRSPLFAAEGQRLLLWLAIAFAAGVAFVAAILYVVYWWPPHYSLELLRFYLRTRSSDEWMQFWLWLIPFVAAVVAVAGLARARRPRDGRPRRVAIGAVAAIAFLNFPVIPHPHAMSEAAFRSTGHKSGGNPGHWRLLRVGPVPLGIIHPYRVDYDYWGENAPSAELHVRWLGPGFGSAFVTDMCDNTILLPCWGGQDGYSLSSGLELWRGDSGSYRVYAPLEAYPSYSGTLPFLGYTFVPVVKWFGLAFWLSVAAILFWRSPRRLRLLGRAASP
jgi:hypothetical protein